MKINSFLSDLLSRSVVLASILILLLLFFYWQRIALITQKKETPIFSEQNLEQINKTGTLNPTRQFDQDAMRTAIFEAEKNTLEKEQQYLGAIVPHHLLAAHLIADAFRQLSLQQPQTIILIAPNHDEAGNSPIITAKNFWQTSLGILETDQTMISKLLVEPNIMLNEEVMFLEAGISDLVPFIQYYFPKTQLVPILVSNRMGNDHVARLIDLLSPYINEKTILIGSVDFSHYLPSTEAQKRDQETRSAIMEKNYEKIMKFGNDHLDSPPALLTVLQIAEQKGAKKEIRENTNSGNITGNYVEPGTSYFEILFPLPLENQQ